MASDHDPYNDMLDSEKNDIRPGFLGGNGDGESGIKKVADGAKQIAAAVATKGKGAGASSEAAGGAGAAAGGKGIGGGKKAMSDGLKSGAKNPNAANAEAKEKDAGGLYNKKRGGNDDNDGEPTLKLSDGAKKGMMMAAPLLILLLGVGALLAIIVALPVLMIGTIDYNLMKILGFENTIAILEKIGEIVTEEFLSKGEVPAKYFSDLAMSGIDVGQVTANGDFVKTNVYIANIEDKNDLVAAASGFSYIPEDEGELAILFRGEVIYAGDFVAAVESKPELYAAYSEAADIDTRYYYSDDAEEVRNNMGISLGNFNDWDSSGSYKQDEEKYFEILNEILDDGSDLAVGGAHRDLPLPDGAEALLESIGIGGGTYAEDVDGEGAEDKSSGEVVGAVSEKTQEYIYRWDAVQVVENGKTKTVYKPVYSDNATERAAQLLNTAVSSSEPYLATSAFVAIEEPIQRARVDGNGPVNEVMNTLTQGKSVTYQNVNTGDNETKSFSILETRNFRAAVSDANYDRDEAENFGRDRIIKSTGLASSMDEDDTIRRSTVTSPDKDDISTVVRNGKDATQAEQGVVSKATENLELSKANKNSDVFQTVIGGNRILEGGSFYSNMLNQQLIAAMPSDDIKIGEYHKEVEEVMARRAEAERTTKSPFDISSPHTFLGSIVHNIATTILGNYGSGLTALSAISSAGNTAGNAIASLMGSATADGANKEYTTMPGQGCETLKVAGGVQGDLYCNSHNTPSTSYMDYTFDDFKSSEIGDEIDDEGKPVEDSGLYEFVNYGMDRYVTVGVKNAEVCERYKADHETTWSKIVDFFKKMDATYDVCDVGTDTSDHDIDLETRKIYTGAKYSFGSDAEGPNKLYSSYVMYDEVKSLLSDSQSAVSKMREEYRKKHPVDKSEAGIISRRSGMSKHEAEIALAYADYLNVIAAYNPSERFAFTAPVVLIEKPILNYHSDEVALNLYAWYSKETEYSDLRTRNFVV